MSLQDSDVTAAHHKKKPNSEIEEKQNQEENSFLLFVWFSFPQI